MREQEVRELYEAYMQVHQPQEEVEQLDENVQDAVKGALEKGANFMKTNPVGKAVSKIIAPVGGGRKTPTATSGGYRKEEIDLFDAILEHLVSEGYADTNESALAIMANMSEEWKQSILTEDPVQDYVVSPLPRLPAWRDMKRADENRGGARGPELSHNTTPGLKGKPQPGRGSVTQKPTVRGREFTNPPS